MDSEFKNFSIEKNALKVPFGKYKDREITDLLADTNYIEWLAQQSWIKEKYPVIFQVIQQYNFEDQPTPEHNAMQNKWLEKEYREKFYKHVLSQYKEYITLENDMSIIFWKDQIEFEYTTKNIDVFIELVGKIYFKKINLFKEKNCCSQQEIIEYRNKPFVLEDGWYTRNYKLYSKELIEKFNEQIKNSDKMFLYICPVHGIERCCNCSNNKEWFNGHQRLQNCTNKFDVELSKTVRIKRGEMYLDYDCKEIQVGIEASDKFIFKIELKPIIGDDYPAILRKMKRDDIKYLICQEFNSKVNSLEQVKKIFNLCNIKFILESEFEGKE